MLPVDLVLAEVRDRQAALRPPASTAVLAVRPNALRRAVGAWIVRLGRAIAGPSAASPRLA
jgi:hypothetical protein